MPRWNVSTSFSSFLALAAIACGAGGTAGPDPTADDLSAYYRSPALCADASGPDCAHLRLGDAHLTTTTPAVGKLYSCTAGNPNAPGSISSRITWIDAASGTWNLLHKPWLPAGGFAPAAGTFAETVSGATRTIQANGMPVDQAIGNWPMSAYALLTAIDPNPGVPAPRTYAFTLPVNPVAAASPGCVSLGAIGVTLNGVVLYNALDGRGQDALAHEIVDVYGGHPAMSDYHYHFVPERLDAAPLSDGHSGIIGYIRDGYPIYGYHGVGGVELQNTDLDACHGHSHGVLGYHYHATIEYPYTIGCYHGTPQ